MSNDKLAWHQIEVSEMHAECQKLYALRADLMAKARKVEDDFEASFVKHHGNVCPEGKQIAFGYRFGRLAIAFMDLVSKAKSSAKNTLKLG
jgi:hypothetical protein